MNKAGASFPLELRHHFVAITFSVLLVQVTSFREVTGDVD